MKPNLAIFFFCAEVAFSQSPNTIDTSYYSNGSIREIIEYDTLFRYSGIYEEYDTTGTLRLKGRYAQLDSAKCLNCYNGTPGHDNQGRWEPINKTKVWDVKIGQWITYHPNGKMAISGQYDTLFTFYHGAVQEIGANRPVPVYIHHEQLKSGIWRYYDETGKLIGKEEYFNGSLVFKMEYY